MIGRVEANPASPQEGKSQGLQVFPEIKKRPEFTDDLCSLLQQEPLRLLSGPT